MTGPASAFKITRVRLRHYRSIAACDVRLGKLGLLVGPNGSGKSNFLDSMRLTSDALDTTLDHALRDRGGIAEVRRRSTGHPTHFRIELNFATADQTGSYSFQIAAVKGGDFRVSHEDCVVRPAMFGGEDSFYRVRDGELVASSEAFMPAVSDDRLYLVSASSVGPFRMVFDGLRAITVYSINPDVMRGLQKPDSGEILRRDGSNAASVLERLRREAPMSKERIEDYLRLVVPGIDGVDRVSLDSWEALEFRQDTAGSSRPWSFRGSSMSDGTLRALGVLLALFSTSRSASTIGIEEPEAALHPAAAGVLLDALRDASEQRQVLVTSHSPDLLDDVSVTTNELVAVRLVDGGTHLARPDLAGREALADSLFTAGELLRADQLLPELPETQQMSLSDV
ncbi:AAA family ATPase [Klenkia sp. LSe6-5]|uniref:AAA family ATPase n=1 Tax=Klenkia sesuvii TaxID=3103137 RepID=A0ABU8DPT0_9ACTN